MVQGGDGETAGSVAEWGVGVEIERERKVSQRACHTRKGPEDSRQSCSSFSADGGLIAAGTEGSPFQFLASFLLGFLLCPGGEGDVEVPFSYWLHFKVRHGYEYYNVSTRILTYPKVLEYPNFGFN